MSSPASLGLEEAKAYLQKSTGDSNLYDHLSELLLKILVEKPDNALDAFEHLSLSMKEGRVESSLPPAPVSKTDIQVKAAQEQWSRSAADLANATSDTDDSRTTTIADVLDEANLWEWAGLGFGRCETFRLSLALAQLAGQDQPSTLRLWGKILGRGVDYYIAEGRLDDNADDDNARAVEGSSGVNHKTYWCLPTTGTYVWTKLPRVTRAQILMARTRRRYVGPDLDAPIPGHPPFPGTERHFLRAQIARIAASTTVAPAGLYAVDDDNDDNDVTPVVDADARPASALQDLGTWVHLSKEINAVYGRCTPMPASDDDDGDDIVDVVPRLQSLTEDKTESWTIAIAPTTPIVGQVAVVKSLVWPGAVAVAVGTKVLNFYVGFGLKTGVWKPTLPEALERGFGLEMNNDGDDDDGDGKDRLVFTNVAEELDVVDDPTPVSTDEPDED